MSAGDSAAGVLVAVAPPMASDEVGRRGSVHSDGIAQTCRTTRAKKRQQWMAETRQLRQDINRLQESRTKRGIGMHALMVEASRG